jgi:hypothetical protein
MIGQGWPLWAYRGDEIYAVIGWVQESRRDTVLMAVGVPLGVPLDGAPAVVLDDGLAFTTQDPTA